MTDDLTNSEIALLCNIAEYDLNNATDEQKRDLKRLVFGGYVERTDAKPGSRFKPTVKGMTFLSERGAGLNEA